MDYLAQQSSEAALAWPAPESPEFDTRLGAPRLVPEEDEEEDEEQEPLSGLREEEESPPDLNDEEEELSVYQQGPKVRQLSMNVVFLYMNLYSSRQFNFHSVT